MGKLDGMWSRIGSVTMHEVIVAVLEDEISLYESRIQPAGTGYLHDSIAQLKRRVEELRKL